jgi:hypothetical protein
MEKQNQGQCAAMKNGVEKCPLKNLFHNFSTRHRNILKTRFEKGREKGEKTAYFLYKKCCQCPNIS